MDIDEQGCLMWLLVGILFILLVVAIPALELWLWGIVMVPVFGAPMLTYWQMFALNWLCGMLFSRSSTNISTKK